MALFGSLQDMFGIDWHEPFLDSIVPVSFRHRKRTRPCRPLRMPSPQNDNILVGAVEHNDSCQRRIEYTSPL